ncbi:hypothetical protein [Streptomyces sp. SID5910]|uniref:hypothetical protein n=1 Tax=Streptomyces sp. SID5910 TaxID=2690312 RepID=UPI00136E593A|nr:hypothetical protein [Streptomyces sp. SID5910]MYR41345.1 hypothetical protein [Streptomyces sp. SID5910]
MSTGVPLASVKSQIFEAVLGFLPDWVQITVIALVLLALVASWVVKLVRRVAARRAARGGAPDPAVTQYGSQGRGADYLGPYAPPRSPQSGADFLGSYAPPRRQGDGSV